MRERRQSNESNIDRELLPNLMRLAIRSQQRRQFRRMCRESRHAAYLAQPSHLSQPMHDFLVGGLRIYA